MLTEYKMPILIAIILCFEGMIYLWTAWTATFRESNFFFVAHELIFEKCARLSGRVSATVNLIVLVMIGCFGLKQIYLANTTLNIFLILVTLFAVNHLIHFFYVYQNFKHRIMVLKIAENKHGFITYMCILLLPIILWSYKELSVVLYSCIVLHLFNVSYIIIETFLIKVKQGQRAYHNRLGILLTTAACIFVLCRFILEY